MIYNTGIISINGNTATGTGTNWTAAASQIRVGQTIIVLSNPVQMFQITAINSGTSLTVTPAASPALSGQKYGILVTDSLSVDGLAQSMSQLINEYDENIGAWETFASTSANQTITVTINGTSVTIPAIGGLARKGANSDITELKGLTTPLSLKQGGLGANNAADARTNIGLGSSAVRDAYSATGKLFSEGDYGLGGNTISGGNSNGNMIANESCGFYAGSINTPTATSYSGIKVKINDNVGFSMAVRQNRAFIQSTESGASMGWREVTMAAVSDITVKTDIVYGDGYSSWDNVGAMQPVTFLYKDDVNKSPRRGFIAQDLEKIDSQYIKKMNGGVDEEGKLREILTLDTNPLLMDALIVVKMLIEKDLERNREMELIKNELENLKIKASY